MGIAADINGLHNQDPVEGFLAKAENLNFKKYEPLRNTVLKTGPINFPISKYQSSLEFISRSIVGQQLSVKAARSIWLRVEQLVSANDKSICDIFDGKYKNDLRSCGVSGNKIKALSSLKSYYEDNNITDDLLASYTHEERSKELQNIWGIGQWTCDMLSIFYFRNTDIWPLGDVGVQRGIKKLMNTDTLSQDHLIRVGKKFKPYRSILCLYAWHILDTEDVI